MQIDVTKIGELVLYNGGRRARIDEEKPHDSIREGDTINVVFGLDLIFQGVVTIKSATGGMIWADATPEWLAALEHVGAVDARFKQMAAAVSDPTITS